MLPSVRNVPFEIWDETTDELVPIAGVLEQVKRLDELGYRYIFDQFQAGDHLTLAINDEYAPAAAFLGTETVNRNPAHVTYAYNPTMDFPADGTSAGHAYWLYNVTLREAGGSAPLGTIDVRSEGFGVADPTPSATAQGAGLLTGGQVPAIPYTSQEKNWSPPAPAPVRDVVDVKASGVAKVTVDATRAHVDCAAQVQAQTDGPLQITLANCPGGGSHTVKIPG
jgi:hypothetical protein